MPDLSDDGSWITNPYIQAAGIPARAVSTARSIQASLTVQTHVSTARFFS